MSEEELPEGWADAELGEVADVVGGGTPPAKDSTNFCEEGGHPWLTPADLSGFEGMYVSRGGRNLTRQGLATSSAKLMPAGTVLMSSRAPIGYLAVAANEICTNQGFKSFICSDALQPEYVLFWLKAINHELQEMGSGSTFAEISGGRAKEIPVQFPPLAEQRRIVEKVEALLAQVNAARARLARVPTILKRFRQSILSAACSGRLTEGWRLTQKSVVDEEDWKESKFGDLLAVKPQNGLYRPQEDYGSGTPIVRIDSFYQGEIGAWNDLKKLRATKDDLCTYGLRPGDLLINRVNSPKFLGKSALVRLVPEPTVFESNIMRCHPDESRLYPEFAVRFLSSLEGLEELRRNAKHAVNQSSINQRDVMDVSVPVPSLPEQHEIVRRVDALFKLADSIEARVAAATARADKITQAILAKAFRGELVPTEAELARQEARDYEPASALLARIRADRTASEAASSPASRTPRRRATVVR